VCVCVCGGGVSDIISRRGASCVQLATTGIEVPVGSPVSDGREQV
jgi:hypothetical protein